MAKNKKKFMMMQVPIELYNFLEGVAKRRRIADDGATRPTWGDIARDLIHKFREAHNKPPEAS